MGIDHFPSTPILRPDPATGSLILREACGLDHEKQIIAVACGADVPADAETFTFRDTKTGREFPAQRSRQDAAIAFVQVELRAYEEYQLAFHVTTPAIDAPVSLAPHDGRSSAIIDNGQWAAEIFLGEWRRENGVASPMETPVPIKRMRVKGSPWRGRVFFDTIRAMDGITSTVLESGPLRIVTLFRAIMGDAHFYNARLVFDAGSNFITIDENFDCGAGDQIVWDFTGNDLPGEIHLLDTTAGLTTRPLHYYFDRRLARLACWNQFSQLHDFSDGYAITFPQGGDAIGFIALGGGSWNGNSHNFLEAWARRWYPGDPASRRLVPPEAKADAAPSPERVAVRPANVCEEHFSIEGWLHHGSRSFALLLAPKNSLRHAGWDAAPPLGAFETHPDRERYRQQLSLLRKIHTQRGMFPLPAQLQVCWSWPVEKNPAATKTVTPPWENRRKDFGIPSATMPVAQRVEEMLEFLKARVFGFWEGSASAYTNPVVSRRLAHDLDDWEWYAAGSHLTVEQMQQSRAWFIFLASLFSSDNYYPGAASMNPGDPAKSLEPAMAGMANQNFFTDVFNMPGMTAQVFSSHPDAAAWRERFTAMWRRQLEYHVYPESGVWEESHTYFHHVLQTVLPTMERRRDDGMPDDFADPAFQKLASSLLTLLTPRDACFGGKRHVAILGDHGVDLHDLYRPLYLRIAENIAALNPALASRLAWAYGELGGIHASSALKPEPPPWRNEYVQGLGYFFRAKGAHGESLMVLRCGSSWAHHHNDDGSLQFFCAGRAWIVDSAFGYPQKNGARKFRADGHSRWSPRDINPLNHFWQFNRGWITHHREEGPLPHAIAFTPVYTAESGTHDYAILRHPILHWRAIVQLSPSAFLVLDRTYDTIPEVIRFHIPIDAPFSLESGPPAYNTGGSYLRIRSLTGVQPPQMPVTDHPTLPGTGDEYATREIQYSLDGKSLSALLVLVENSGSPSALAIKENDGIISVGHPDFQIALELQSPESVDITDLKSNTRVTIPMGREQPAS